MFGDGIVTRGELALLSPADCAPNCAGLAVKQTDSGHAQIFRV